MTELATVLLSLLMLDTPVPVTGRCPDGRVWATSDAEQTHMLGLINGVRAERARPPLQRLGSLDRMAMVHAADMACRGYFDHLNPERQALADRLNVAAGAECAGVVAPGGNPGHELVGAAAGAELARQPLTPAGDARQVARPGWRGPGAHRPGRSLPHVLGGGVRRRTPLTEPARRARSRTAPRRLYWLLSSSCSSVRP